MILVDTLVWMDHLRAGNEGLSALLHSGRVLTHPFVLGELACGNLRQRAEVLLLLEDLPRAKVARDEEVLFFIERHELMGRGIGYVDAHLMAAVVLDGGARLWTQDKGLKAVASVQGMAFEPAQRWRLKKGLKAQCR